MSAATELWAAIVASYEPTGLIALTNLREPDATTIDTATGQNAAQGVIDLWPAYAQVVYDKDNALHVEVGKRATIALLWQRGGTSATIAKVEWDEVFGSSGMIAMLRNVGSRARMEPVSNSRVRTTPETINGESVRGWSDRDALPEGILPRRLTASGDND